MANLSKIRREKMLSFLESLKEQHSDDESLISINQIEHELASKKYGLVWEEHDEEVESKLEKYIPVFKELSEKELTLKKSNNNYNFICEGDNLHTLHLLEKTNKNKIKMIYIDPPYNTGNKDFVYNDEYIDVNDSFRHSKWLSFMYKRLVIAKKLLTKEGVIFISIDDNEMVPLKMLCDEIFGEINYVANIIVKSNPRGSQSKKEIASVHEYILVYAKDIFSAAIIGHKLTENMTAEYKYEDKYGKYRLLGLRQRGGFWRADERPNLYYPFYINPEDASIELEVDEKHYVEVFPIQPSTGVKGTWRWSKEKVVKDKQYLMAKSIKRGGNMTWDIYQKDYILSGESARRTKAKTLWDEKEMNYQNAANELKEIFGTSPFTYAKPVYLIKKAMEMIDFSDNDIVLDFFAGTGTTGQAVLEMNKEDGVERKFILCTNDENNICEKITYQRLKTVISGKRMNGSIYSNGIPANLKFYKTTFVNKDSEELTGELLNHTIEMIQLQFGISGDNQKYVIIMDDEEMDIFENNISKYNNLQAVFINQDVLLSTSQEKMLESINTYIIPDCYFDFELREVGELW